mmetsp:Transcript_30645/g.49834  ORF Transcript_30645/g.49834 Transcript_30645/m.49834 type:complete len:83 (+) Transcript_30645:117-365(+)
MKRKRKRVRTMVRIIAHADAAKNEQPTQSKRQWQCRAHKLQEPNVAQPLQAIVFRTIQQNCRASDHGHTAHNIDGDAPEPGA